MPAQGQNRKRARSSSRPSRKLTIRRSLKASTSLQAINNQVVSTMMGTTGSFTVNNTTGFNGAGLTICFACQQDRVMYSIAGGAFVVLGSAFSNAPSFAAIYDMYRCNKMEVTILYSNNSSVLTGTLALPILYGVVDYDDSLALTSASDALSYATCQVMQLGNSAGTNNGKQVITVKRPAVRTSVETTNIALGTVTSGMIVHSPWLNSDTTNVEQNGVKFLLDTIAQTATAVGVITFSIKCFFDYKFTK